MIHGDYEDIYVVYVMNINKDVVGQYHKSTFEKGILEIVIANEARDAVAMNCNNIQDI